MGERAYKICGGVEVVPCVMPAGGRGQEARVEVALCGAEGQPLLGSQAVWPECTFGSLCEAMDATLLHGQHLLREWVRDSTPRTKVTT